MTTETLRILIAEDHDLSRNGLSCALQKKTSMSIVGEAENGKKALELAKETAPDVVLMDISMPVMDGVEATQQLKRLYPDIRIIILTSHSDGEGVYASLAAGADAYCLKDISMDRLIQVIEMVADGAVWLDPAIASMVMQTLPLSIPKRLKPEPEHKKHQNRHKYNTELTDRELEVLNQIVEGKSNKEIALSLDITIHTVKAHVCNIIQKLAVDDRTQAAIKAMRDGLV